MFGTFVKYQFQRTYDAILAAPVDTEELVTAEALWIAAPRRRLRLRAAARRDRVRPRSVLGDADRAVHRLARRVRLGVLRDHDRRLRVVDRELQLRDQRRADAALPRRRHLLPAEPAPRWAQILADFNPLHHCVELVRHAAFGFDGWTDLGRVGVLAGFGLVMWRVAIYAMTRKLVDCGPVPCVTASRGSSCPRVRDASDRSGSRNLDDAALDLRRPLAFRRTGRVSQLVRGRGRGVSAACPEAPLAVPPELADRRCAETFERCSSCASRRR